MGNRPFYILILLLPILIILTSCDKFINLGDASNSKDYDDGLPEDLSGSEDSDRWDEGGSDFEDSGNTGNSGNGEYADEDDSAINDNDDDDEYSDIDKETPPKLLEEYPFPEDFTNDQCECGTNPGYNPVCCKGISVFNACFANCYFLYSEGTICSSYSQGICDSIPQPGTDEDSGDDTDEYHDDPTDETVDTDAEELDSDTDLENPDDEPVEDNDEELTSDEDYIPDNECGCYPSDTEFLCCYKNSTVIVSSCLADCHCNGAYTPCF
jgi:hypothetical protein